MSLNQQIELGFTETNSKLKQVRDLITAGVNTLDALNTIDKSSLIGAINEAFAAAGSGTGVIDDTALPTVNDKAYSALKISQLIETAKTAVKDELIDGASADMDTFLEVAAQFTANGGDLSQAMLDIAANTSLITTAQNTADTAVANAATAQGGADTANAAVTTLSGNIGATGTDYAAIVSAGL